jgi:putative two-component system response regulator
MSEPTAQILVADDQPENLMLIEAFLGAVYRVHTVGDGQAVLDHLDAGRPADLILLDIVMPRLDGFETCRRIKATPATRDIPVLFLTTLNSTADEEKDLGLGAEDFIHKPFSPPVVLARVRNHLSLAGARRDLREHNRRLEQLVDERTAEIRRQADDLMSHKQRLIAAQSATIAGFCAMAEARDNETGNHIRRTQRYVRVLAESLCAGGRFVAQLDPRRIDLLERSAPLHDIGKVGIPDRILLKPGGLDPEEWRVMQTHCRLGFEAIQEVARELTDEDDFLQYAREIAYGHHERWDGTGYPQGLAGEAIPLSARLMAVADVYDALISRRVYKPAFPHAQAVAMMEGERGRHFDPEVLDTFLTRQREFHAIAQRFADPDHEATHPAEP